MGSWKNHVRARLLQRDHEEKLPFVGVFTSLSQLEERFEIRKQIFEDIQSRSLEAGGVEVGKNINLERELRESEHLADKLSQTVSDLTAVLYLKEAELQYWQSRVSQYRHEALALAKGNKNLKASLLEFELTTERQSKDLAALRSEQSRLKEALEQAHADKDRLLQRWIKEKEGEADRLNKYNDKQERWQHLAKQLKKCLRSEKRKEFASVNGAKETSSSVLQRMNTTKDSQPAADSQLQQKPAVPLGP
ncbi:autophagy-related protein 16 [Kryptolebias marmoratus]|uniref:autophagy-related protein 16 n=1 Tax=Kryptolebias marmoratus TaxID=37003 RepID=UPI0007F931AC|nr:autophagy-related protein 16 [Kryptolebias marmoratus]